MTGAGARTGFGDPQGALTVGSVTQAARPATSSPVRAIRVETRAAVDTGAAVDTRAAVDTWAALHATPCIESAWLDTCACFNPGFVIIAGECAASDTL